MSRRPANYREPIARHEERFFAESRAEDHVFENAMSHFGDDAPTAIAYCGIDAWLEGEDIEAQRWGRLFQRFRN